MGSIGAGGGRLPETIADTPLATVRILYNSDGRGDDSNKQSDPRVGLTPCSSKTTTTATDGASD